MQKWMVFVEDIKCFIGIGRRYIRGAWNFLDLPDTQTTSPIPSILKLQAIGSGRR